MIDVKELIQKYSVADLNQTAEAYYRAMNPASLARKPFILPGLQHFAVELSFLIVGLDLRPGDRVLDFGCGTGWTSRILNACGCDVIGVDVSETALDLAAELAERWRQAGLLDASNGPLLEFRRYDGLRINVDDESVDKVFVLDAFHHVPDQAATLREFARVLRPGGTVGMCEPGPNHSKHPDSQREMALHKVVENDIVLDDIELIASGLGFSELRVCLSQLLPTVVDYAAYKRFPRDPELARQFLETTDWRVKNYPIFFLRRNGTRILDSRGLDGLTACLKLRSPGHLTCRAGDTPEICLTVINTGSATWLPSGVKPGSVNIGYMLVTQDNTTQHRYTLASERTPPGTEFDVAFRLPPIGSGHHEVKIDLVAEHVAWLRAADGDVVTVTIEAVMEPGAQSDG